MKEKTMACYILELQDMDEKVLSALQHEDELRSELMLLIERAHYSGTGYQLSGIWRWNDSGSQEVRAGLGRVTEMYLRFLGEDRSDEGDWLYWDYEVIPHDHQCPNGIDKFRAIADRGKCKHITFTVRIDGRA